MSVFIPPGTYEQQRRDRLADVIGDYLNDEEVSARRFYEDLLAEVQDWKQYYKRQYDKYQQAESLLHGHRPIDLSNVAAEIGIDGIGG